MEDYNECHNCDEYFFIDNGTYFEEEGLHQCDVCTEKVKEIGGLL